MFLPEFLNLGAGFSKYFSAVPALTDELRTAGYRIRHDVYCRELGFEAVQTKGVETDRYDAQSLHCLLRSKTNAEYVGCIRIILAARDDPLAPLPFEQTCAHTLDRSIIDPAHIDRSKMAEVSRLAVIRDYRRRRGEAKSPGGMTAKDFGVPDHPRFPYIPVGLYLGMIVLAQRAGIENLFVLTEPRLAKHLSRLGVKIRQIGGPVEHRGTRVPSMMQVDSIVRGLNFLVRPLYNVIAEEIDAAHRELAAQRENS